MMDGINLNIPVLKAIRIFSHDSSITILSSRTQKGVLPVILIEMNKMNKVIFVFRQFIHS